jgi:hypothetical protein
MLIVPMLWLTLIANVIGGDNVVAAEDAASMSSLQEASATIAELRCAAAARDLAKLRSLMTDEFIWSFGGDASADQAIAAWRDDSRYLDRLRATLERGCHRSGHDELECPGAGGGDFRAGLVKVPAGWRLYYLVAGD